MVVVGSVGVLWVLAADNIVMEFCSQQGRLACMICTSTLTTIWFNRKRASQTGCRRHFIAVPQPLRTLFVSPSQQARPDNGRRSVER